MTYRGRIGIVVIGRNEGDRLMACLDSLGPPHHPVVYVDSHSVDGSAGRARAKGAVVVELDESKPLSAARARNAGFRALCEGFEGIEFVQFLDGDMRLVGDWIPRAVACLEADPAIVAVCGIRREVAPTRNLFHRIADVEWQSQVFGDSETFGGDVIIRREAFTAERGYDEAVVAAEDNELALRLRARGGRIRRLEAPSALHDIASDSLVAWWRRAMRTGQAYAQVSRLHAASGYWAGEPMRALAWGVALPGVAAGLAIASLPAAIAVLALLPLQMLRVAVRTHRLRPDWGDCVAWGFHCSFGKIPQALGVIGFCMARRWGHRIHLIEHRSQQSGGRRAGGE